MAKKQQYSLSPSEQIVLHGDTFSTTNCVNRILLPSGQKVSVKRLAVEALAYGFLKSHALGTIELQVHDENSVIVMPRARTLPWPEFCFEREIHDIAGRLVARRRNTVLGTVFDWLETETFSGWHAAVVYVWQGLQERGLVTLKHKGLNRLVPRCAYTEGIKPVLDAWPADMVKQDLEHCKSEYKELLRPVKRQADEAMETLTEYIDLG